MGPHLSKGNFARKKGGKGKEKKMVTKRGGGRTKKGSTDEICKM